MNTELATYRDQLEIYLQQDHEGEFVVIQGEDALGFYPDQVAALKAGYDHYGLDPFLVKRVTLDEKAAFLPVCGNPHVKTHFGNH